MRATEIVTAEELRELLKAHKRSKYKSVRCDCPLRHQSMKEHHRSVELHMMERSGLISELREQVAFVLAPSVVLQGRKKPALRYVLDFQFRDTKTGQMQYEDVKSIQTPVFRIKAHLMRSVHGIEITLS